MNVIGVIPARYASKRLPGKPMKIICGKPMLRWVYERCLHSSKLKQVVAAIDDDRVKEVCLGWNIPYIMTGTNHRTGANRLYEVSNSINADYYVQINGDEPLIDVSTIDAVVPTAIPDDEPFGTNIVCPIYDMDQIKDPSNIKVVFDMNNNMKYMSRNPIPYSYTNEKVTIYKHVGILGYNKKMLDFYNESKPGMLEKIECIDTLRFIDYNKTLKAIKVEKYDSLSVDTEQDLEYVRHYMEKIKYE